MELIIVFIVIAVLYTVFQNKNTSLEKKEEQTTMHNHYTQNNIYVQNNYGYKPEAHTSRVWKKLGYEVNYGESYAYKYYGNEIYTEDQVRKISTFYGRHLSSKQKKVKSLGTALVKKSGSKQKAKNILVDHYGFDEDTAKYGAGFSGYANW